jgi:carbamoyl-phosphate synthase large subunit
MAKFAHEMELQFIYEFRAGQFSTVCARIFRGYGRNSRDIISRWIRSLLNGEAITVYREQGLFDYIYAADSAEGLIRLAEKTSVTGIINLGTGLSRRVSEVVEILGKYFPGMESVVAESDILFEASQAEMSNYRELIGWLPEYDLEEAIPQIIAFERDRKESISSVSKLPPPVVLITSASRKTPLVRAMKSAATRVEKSARIVAGDISQNTLAAYVADEFWLMPPAIDEMLEKIVDGCKARGINIVLPTRDGELQFWARHAEYLAKQGINAIISPTSSLNTCIDKQLFSDFCVANYLPVIPSSLNIEGIKSSRYVVKERFGAGSHEIGIDLNLAEAKAHAKTLEQPIFQPYIKGMEFSVDAWVDSFHKVKGLILRRRDLVVNGESQITTTFTDPLIETEVQKVIETLKLRGPVVLQVIQDSLGKLNVIECNARFGGASTTGIAVGVDSFFWSILEARGSCVDDYPFLRSSEELRQVRLPADIYIYDSNF